MRLLYELDPDSVESLIGSYKPAVEPVEPPVPVTLRIYHWFAFKTAPTWRKYSVVEETGMDVAAKTTELSA